MLRQRPMSTEPGPTSMKRWIPRSASAWTDSVQAHGVRDLFDEALAGGGGIG